MTTSDKLIRTFCYLAVAGFLIFVNTKVKDGVLVFGAGVLLFLSVLVWIQRDV